jgi:adenine-specific DNA-methyltransferase
MALDLSSAIKEDSGMNIMPDATPLSMVSAKSSTLRTSLIKSKATVAGGNLDPYTIWQGDAEAFLAALPKEPVFDLVVSSPPYNIGKSYEKKGALQSYLEWQERILDLIIPRLKNTGSICWQVGNFVTTVRFNRWISRWRISSRSME